MQTQKYTVSTSDDFKAFWKAIREMDNTCMYP